jgi:hypothetical protein
LGWHAQARNVLVAGFATVGQGRIEDGRHVSSILKACRQSPVDKLVDRLGAARGQTKFRSEIEKGRRESALPGLQAGTQPAREP